MIMPALEEILLIGDAGNFVLESVASISYTDTLDVPQHKTADGYSIHDHILQNPVGVSVNMTVPNADFAKLVALKDKRSILRFVSATRSLERVVISALSNAENGYIDTTTVNMKLQEIVYATAKASSESLEILKNASESRTHSEGAAQTPQSMSSSAGGAVSQGSSGNISAVESRNNSTAGLHV